MSSLTPHTKSTISSSTVSNPIQVLPIRTEQTLPPSTLKKRRTTHNTKKNDDRRLVEYFLIVSCVPKEVSPRRSSIFFAEDVGSEKIGVNPVPEDASEERLESEKEFDPVISARYPKEDIESNPLHESVTSFCFPYGEIRLLSKANMPKVIIINTFLWILLFLLIPLLIIHALFVSAYFFIFERYITLSLQEEEEDNYMEHV